MSELVDFTLPQEARALQGGEFEIVKKQLAEDVEARPNGSLSDDDSVSGSQGFFQRSRNSG